MSSKLPKTIGTVCDKLLALRDERLALQKAADAIAAKESELKTHFIKLASKQRVDKASGAHATVSFKTEAQPQVLDWEAVHAYVVEHDAWDIMRRQLNPAAWRDREMDGQHVKGTESVPVIKVSITKRGA
jgi:hypothetical protein